jgi:hypothetical protein
LRRAYKLARPQAGVFQIKNLKNGKVLLGSSLNLHGPLNRFRFELSTGMHGNADLQKDWNELGPSSFSFDILEVLKQKDDPSYDVEQELEILEMIWLEKLQPVGEKGYNKNTRIRM